MNKTQILYFYDALCGWCYGFSPVIQQLYQKYQDQFEFHIISGGLKYGDAAGAIGVVAPYIKAGAYKTVEEQCGVKFGAAFVEGPLQEGTMIMDSLPPATALSIVKEENPSVAFEFGAILHRAIYVDGMHPRAIDGYSTYAQQIGLDPDNFVQKLNTEKYKQLALQDFGLAKRFGITGFPTLVGIQGEKAFLLAQGYRKLEAVEAIFASL